MESEATRKGIGGHTRANRGRTDDWLTPKFIIDALGPFDLDPCVASEMPWRTANEMWSEGGLERDWGTGLFWLNPPYGPETHKWLAIAKDKRGIALIFARTETKMFFDSVWSSATAVFFIEGRLHFYDTAGKRAVGNAGGPSVLIAYGDECAERLRTREGISGIYLPLSTSKQTKGKT